MTQTYASKALLKVGLVIADDMEYLPFLKWAEGYPCETMTLGGNEARRVTLAEAGRTIELTGVKCGIGKVNAAAAASFLIASGAEMILNCGLSGGMSGAVRGGIVGGTSFVEADFDLTPLGRPLGVKPSEQPFPEADGRLFQLFCSVMPGVPVGRFGCGDFFLTDPVRRDDYRERFGLIAFDMESGAVANICQKCGVPFFAFRQISDTADESSGSDYNEMNDRAQEDLMGVLGRLLGAALREDSLWS
ncbi:MAG: 5'-methylthioadenosine/S-adenosylhomocysteine nucleosidase [Clostridiales bacterium]|nr:5'-methylthioadenosine/S-adenosylhomocysteine nucleosidase [Clostridiales bacterium]